MKETVDATLNRTVSSGISGASYYEGTFANISRSKAGDYVAVSSRGLCRTWQLGSPCCCPASITCSLPGTSLASSSIVCSMQGKALACTAPQPSTFLSSAICLGQAPRRSHAVHGLWRVVAAARSTLSPSFCQRLPEFVMHSMQPLLLPESLPCMTSLLARAGNFYLTWTPGADTWQPHNRPSPRRVQNMGWTPANELWLSVRGGDLLISAETGAASEKFDKAKLGSRGFGILDVGWASASHFHTSRLWLLLWGLSSRACRVGPLGRLVCLPGRGPAALRTTGLSQSQRR